MERKKSNELKYKHINTEKSKKEENSSLACRMFQPLLARDWVYIEFN
jgi:predicted nucleotidyltransferase